MNESEKTFWGLFSEMMYNIKRGAEEILCSEVFIAGVDRENLWDYEDMIGEIIRLPRPQHFVAEIVEEKRSGIFRLFSPTKKVQRMLFSVAQNEQRGMIFNKQIRDIVVKETQKFGIPVSTHQYKP